MSRDPYLVPQVLQAFAALDALAESDAPMGPTELAERLGWPKSRAYTYMATLVRAGAVEQCDHGTYRLAPKSQRFGYLRPLVRQRAGAAFDALLELMRGIGEPTEEEIEDERLTG